jgi:transcriptional regulator with PAS, ATPase and Fis domain
VGGSEEIQLNLRLITATNQDLPSLVRAGRFREDLYYRLNVISIHLPPLRERKEDVPLLIKHFLEKRVAELERMVGRLTMENELLKKARAFMQEQVRRKESLLPPAMPRDGQLVKDARQ